jgi:hypothetical protein
MRLKEGAREEIEVKYREGTSDEILIHLKRNFPIYVIKYDWMETPVRMINIYSKSLPIVNNKKDVKKRLFFFLEERFPDVSASVLNKTLKKFLDMIISLEV